MIGLRNSVVAAVFASCLYGQTLPERFDRELFANDMRPLSDADAQVVRALGEYAGCEFNGIMKGSFTSPNATEAVVSAGCGEAHADNYGSTLLIANHSGVWIIIWREPGLITRHCARIRFGDGRNGLLCRDRYTHMGSREQYLYSVDVARPAKQRQAMIVATLDTMRAGDQKSTESNLERVEIGPQLRVWVRHGVAELPEEIREKNVVGDAEPADIHTVIYRLEFSLAGTSFTPSDETRKLLKVISPTLVAHQ